MRRRVRRRDTRTATIARRIGTPPRRLEAILQQARKEGLVDGDEGGPWRLTARAERRYGRAFRAIAPLTRPEDDS
jgi:DNA-binding IscR family transcriptional regulator